MEHPLRVLFARCAAWALVNLRVIFGAIKIACAPLPVPRQQICCFLIFCTSPMYCLRASSGALFPFFSPCHSRKYEGGGGVQTIMYESGFVLQLGIGLWRWETPFGSYTQYYQVFQNICHILEIRQLACRKEIGMSTSELTSDTWTDSTCHLGPFFIDYQMSLLLTVIQPLGS